MNPDPQYKLHFRMRYDKDVYEKGFQEKEKSQSRQSKRHGFLLAFSSSHRDYYFDDEPDQVNRRDQYKQK